MLCLFLLCQCLRSLRLRAKQCSLCSGRKTSILCLLTPTSTKEAAPAGAGLTPAGVAHSWVLGTSVFSAFGLGGYILVCLYFIFGSAVRSGRGVLCFAWLGSDRP